MISHQRLLPVYAATAVRCEKGKIFVRLVKSMEILSKILYDKKSRVKDCQTVRNRRNKNG